MRGPQRSVYYFVSLFHVLVFFYYRFQVTEKDVLVYYKAFSSPTKHGFIGAGVIKRPLYNVWDMVKDVHARRLYDKSILSSCVHQRVSSTVQLGKRLINFTEKYARQDLKFSLNREVKGRIYNWVPSGSSCLQYSEYLPQLIAPRHSILCSLHISLLAVFTDARHLIARLHQEDANWPYNKHLTQVRRRRLLAVHHLQPKCLQ